MQEGCLKLKYMEHVVGLFVLCIAAFGFSLANAWKWKSFDKETYKYAKGKTSVKMLYSRRDFADYVLMLIVLETLLVCVLFFLLHLFLFF